MKLRKQLITKLFEWSQKIYIKYKKKKAWNITTLELLNFPKGTFGKRMGTFLNDNGFELIPKVERHDAYHTLTGFGTNVEDEIALQYLCFGNGKRTPYLLGVLILGTILLPEYLSYYFKSFKIGKEINSFHHFDFKHLLHDNYETFRNTIFSSNHLAKLKILQKSSINRNSIT